MVKIGIIFAMKEELAALQKQIDIINEYSIFECIFYEAILNGYKLILVESGIGKVNAARCCQILIDNMEVDYIFNIGVAGSISKNVGIGDIVVGEKLVQHDFDITAFHHEKGYIPNIGTFIDSDEYLIKVSKQIETPAKLHFGIIASGDIFCTEKWMSEKIATKFNALCVEMEGASIAQVCFLAHIPFLVIRSISDSIYEDNNTVVYEEFLKTSSTLVADFLKKIIESLM